MLHILELREDKQDLTSKHAQKENYPLVHRGCCGRMVVEFTTGCAINAYYH
jgi:hypothetical protein